MAEPMTEEELQDLRARVERVPLCYQREADTTIARLLATVNELTVENSELYASLDATMNEADHKLSELASAAGVAWEGRSHEEVVELVKALRPLAEDTNERNRR